MTETNLDESRPDLEFAIAGAGAEESLGPLLLDRDEAVTGLLDQQFIKSPAVDLILKRKR